MQGRTPERFVEIMAFLRICAAFVAVACVAPAACSTQADEETEAEKKADTYAACYAIVAGSSGDSTWFYTTSIPQVVPSGLTEEDADHMFRLHVQEDHTGFTVIDGGCVLGGSLV